MTEPQFTPGPSSAPTTDPTPLAAAMWQELSEKYAAQGERRLAQLAAWVSATHVLEDLLWRNGLGEAPDPAAELAAIGEAVAASLESSGDSLTGPLSSRQTVELAREAMVDTFDTSVHELLVAAFAPLDHLDVTGPGTTADPGDPEGVQKGLPRLSPRGRDRLAGQPAEHLVASLRATAADCMVVADMMAQERADTAAFRLGRQADIASFEAYLTAAAARAGDEELATVDLRWDLAVMRDRPAERLVDGCRQALAAEREDLLALVGSAERVALHRLFEPLPAG